MLDEAQCKNRRGRPSIGRRDEQIIKLTLAGQSTQQVYMALAGAMSISAINAAKRRLRANGQLPPPLNTCEEFRFRLFPDAAAGLRSAATLRGKKPSTLARELITTIVMENLFNAVMGD